MNLFDSYSKLGWHLFPLLPRSKAPATPNGFKDSSSDIEHWKIATATRPNYNWGLATGASSLLVVDIDVHKGGSLAQLETFVGKLPDTIEAKTGGGGIHLVYELPAGVQSPATRLAILPGIDILSATGYIVIEPSIHPNGNSYSWLEGKGPGDRSPSIAPQSLLDFVVSHKNESSMPLAEGEEIFLGPGTGRWDQLRKFAGRMRAWGWSHESILGALEAFVENQVELDSSVTHDKIRDLVRFVCKKPAQNNLPLSSVTVRYPNGEVKSIKLTELRDAAFNGAVVMKEIK